MGTKIMNGPSVEYEFVYRLLPRKIYKLKRDGFYHEDGWARGALIMSTSLGKTMHHRLDELLMFRAAVPPYRQATTGEGQ